MTSGYTRRRGFTLLELVIVVVVVAVLASVALPGYQDQVRKSRRASAQSHLLDIAQREQQYLLDTRSYASTIAALNMATPAEVSAYYTVAITTAGGPPPSFTASATPIASQAGDLGGAALTVDNTGLKTPAGVW